MNEYPLPGSYVATPMERGYSGSALWPPSAVQAADPHGPSCAGAPAPQLPRRAHHRLLSYSLTVSKSHSLSFSPLNKTTVNLF